MKKITIEIQEKPPSVNHIWKHSGRRVYLSAEGRKFKENLGNKVPKEFKPFEGELRVEIDLTFPDNRKRDLDNYPKVILDSLNHKVFIDDSQIIELLIRKKVQKNRPNIIILVEKI